MRNGKITALARYVKRIVLTFDLLNVSESQFGEEELYLIIKDADKRILKNEGEKAKVNLKGLFFEMDILASKKVNLQENQRVKFNFEIKERLAAGYHNVLVYSKNGFKALAHIRKQLKIRGEGGNSSGLFLQKSGHI